MPKHKTKRPSKQLGDGPYLLKLVLFSIIGAQWVWLVNQELTRQIPVPAGLLIGFGFAMHDHFKIDRKIEYAVLLISCMIGFWANSGVIIKLLN